jgi:Putative transmembrane protein (PGPGW)
MDWIKSQLRSLAAYETLWWWSFAISVALLLLTPLLVAYVVLHLPKDYFTAKRRQAAGWPQRHPALRPIVVVAKNALGILLVVAGLVMLVVPGQGLLTLVVGLMLCDFPGKFRLERWLATRSQVWRSLNWLRKRFGREPLERPKEAD